MKEENQKEIEEGHRKGRTSVSLVLVASQMPRNVSQIRFLFSSTIIAIIIGFPLSVCTV